MKVCRTGKVKLEFLLEFGIAKSFNSNGEMIANFLMPPPSHFATALSLLTCFRLVVIHGIRHDSVAIDR